ncbi:hypothetical protein [Aliikangiella maris]|uniref:Uncharacterized protein n=2 Tax=Aliikangiella maris TaxID=3162458 RepID=A0ABV3MLP5_9GAMM
MRLFILVLSLYVYSFFIEACSCAPLAPKKLIEQATYIYTGKVIKAELTENKGIKTTFKVIDKFKGELNDVESVLVDPAGCQIEYTVGHSYVILADENKLVSLCSGYDYYFKNEIDKHSHIPYTGILDKLRKESN